MKRSRGVHSASYFYYFPAPSRDEDIDSSVFEKTHFFFGKFNIFVRTWREPVSSLWPATCYDFFLLSATEIQKIWTSQGFSKSCNFASFWSWINFLISRFMYCSRSVHFRGLLKKHHEILDTPQSSWCQAKNKLEILTKKCLASRWYRGGIQDLIGWFQTLQKWTDLEQYVNQDTNCLSNSKNSKSYTDMKCYRL